MKTEHDPSTHSQLVERLRNGDLRALELLRAEFDARLFDAVRRRVPAGHDRNDLAEETTRNVWIRLWLHPERLAPWAPGPEGLFPYLRWLADCELRLLLRNGLHRQGERQLDLAAVDLIDPKAMNAMVSLTWEEFVPMLTPGDRSSLEWHTTPGTEGPMSPAQRQATRQLRGKIEGHFRPN